MPKTPTGAKRPADVIGNGRGADRAGFEAKLAEQRAERLSRLAEKLS